MKSLGCGMVLLTLLACEADEPCDEGEQHVQGACVVDDDEPAGGTGGKGAGGRDDAGTAGKDAGTTKPAEDSGMVAECDEDRAAILGKACSEDSACNCAAPYCAKMPGQMSGLCTVYCEPDPDDCPEGYRCFDLSAIGVPGYDPFCIAE